MTIEVAVTNPSLPPLYNARGFFLDLYAIVQDQVIQWLVSEGRLPGSNPGGNNPFNYTYEILQNGVPLDVTQFNLTIATNGVLSADDGIANISLGQTLTNIAIRITDNVAVDDWTSPTFSWLHILPSPSLPPLNSDRNWNGVVKNGITIHQYMCIAEDCEGRQIVESAPNDSNFSNTTPLHYIPIRRGAPS